MKKIFFIILVTFTAAILYPQIHTTYLWHLQQPTYWPEKSQSNPNRYQVGYESLQLKGSQNGHPENDLEAIFGKDDRKADYVYYPKNAVNSISDLPNAGAQVNYSGCLIENVNSFAQAGMFYPSDWYNNFRVSSSGTTSGGFPRIDIIMFSFHHVMSGLVDEEVLRKDIQIYRQMYNKDYAWGPSQPVSKGYFPAETCYSERINKVLVEEGIEWCFVPNIHISRACIDYPYSVYGDNNNPPNPADQINESQNAEYMRITISRGCAPAGCPMAYRSHYTKYVDPETGQEYKILVVPTAQAEGWNEGYGSYGTGEISSYAHWDNDASKPFIVVLAHDGDNAWAGGSSYYNENVSGFSHAAAANGWEPTTVEQFLHDHPVDPNDVIHVEDGGWVNESTGFGDPQYIHWNWPLWNDGTFDPVNGWAEDQRNWAVLTASTNRVVTAEQISGSTPNIEKIMAPDGTASNVEKAWHFLLPGFTSGYMYYGAAIDMEVKPSLASNNACEFADLVIGDGSSDQTGPTIWLPQRFPYNPGGNGAGSLHGWSLTPQPSDFYVYTFVYDVSGLSSVKLKYRTDNDGVNPLSSNQNEIYSGGSEVGSWQSLDMNIRDFPKDNITGDGSIDFFILPDYIADLYYIKVTGLKEVLIDYYVEATDNKGNVKKSPIQHVYIGKERGSTDDEIYSNQTITITNTKPGYLHWGINNWTAPNQVYWPSSTELWSDGKAVETLMLGPNDDGNYYITLGPFNNSAQEVTQIDIIFHNDDGSWEGEKSITVLPGGGNNLPTVNVTKPHTGEIISGTYSIQWNASDEDGDVLIISIYYSTNNGVSWIPIVSSVSNSGSYSWNTNDVSDGSEYTIKVEATDGTGVTRAVTSSFTVKNNSNNNDGDVNGDNIVDGLDLIQLAVCFGTSTGDAEFNSYADLNSDGTIDGLDLIQLAVNFGTQY